MYKVTIGLEVHCELKSTSKNFSHSPNRYETEPNVNVTPVDLGYPGILPVVNKYATKQALKVALALNCETPKYLTFERKNYYYPDLPKGYQITQMNHPVGINGYLMIKVNGKDKKVLIHDTHLEEDTASLDHYGTYSLIDYNRCGVPLLETVTEPCLNSKEEAIAFLESLRNLFLYCDVSEARADRGQIRCDVNVSLAKEDAKELGTKVEMKNINSFVKVAKAIDAEVERQTKILDNGKVVEQETRRYDEENNTTYLMRKKEDAIDYKYFTEPNIPPVLITDEWIKEIKDEIPELQYSRLNKYLEEYKLQEKNANTIVRDKKISDYFENTIKLGSSPKEASNWITGNIMSYMNEHELTIEEIYLTPKMLNDVIKLINDGKISSNQAKELVQKSLEDNIEPLKLVEKLGMSQITDEQEIIDIINTILDENNNIVEDYKKGKNVTGFIIGLLMKKTNGKINPAIANKLLPIELNKR